MNVPTSLAREVTLVGSQPTPPLPNRGRQGSALEESSATAARQFQDRARLYGALDSRLHSKTRFFGAACVTNRVLAHWAAVGGSPARAGLCAGWLSELGASLETVNRSIAEAVHAGSLTGAALDERIVSLEQAVVERSLHNAKASRTNAYFEVLPAIDVLLNRESWLSALHFSSAVRWYRRVLAGVRDELHSPIEFARQCHREKIGMALISALRRDELSSSALLA